MTQINLMDLVEKYVQFIRETAIRSPEHLETITEINLFADSMGFYCPDLQGHTSLTENDLNDF
jgi:hypothetical protein